METRDLSAADIALFERAEQLLDRVHHAVRHQVAAALVTRGGEIHTGLHLGSRRINVCAESSAIANAQMNDDRTVRTIVAVCKDDAGRIVVTNPCGVCRELLGTYGEHADVLVDVSGTVRKVRAADLMPSPWMFPYESHWNVQDPREGDRK